LRAPQLTTERDDLQPESASANITIAEPCACSPYAEAPTTLIARASVNHTRHGSSRRDLAAPRAGRFANYSLLQGSAADADRCLLGPSEPPGLLHQTSFARRMRPLRRDSDYWDGQAVCRIGGRPSGFQFLWLGFRATLFDGNLHRILHRIFEGHLDSEQAEMVGRFGLARFHRPA
jgi:hypothetical protein